MLEYSVKQVFVGGIDGLPFAERKNPGLTSDTVGFDILYNLMVIHKCIALVWFSTLFLSVYCNSTESKLSQVHVILSALLEPRHPKRVFAEHVILRRYDEGSPNTWQVPHSGDPSRKKPRSG